MQGRVTGKIVTLCFWQRTTEFKELPVKPGKAVSWLLGSLQGLRFPQLEECWGPPLTYLSIKTS